MVRTSLGDLQSGARSRPESFRGGLIDAEHGQESFLGDIHAADALHPLLAFLLLLDELALPGDVAAVALGDDVLALGADGLSGDHPRAHGGLEHHFEELAGDELLHLLGQHLAAGVGLVPVDDEREASTASPRAGV